jgi:hypothetical protein
MDTDWLHVGIFPISKNPNGLFVFGDSVDFVDNIIGKILVDNKILEKREKPTPMPQLISWGNKPEQEVDQLYDFNNSRQGKIFVAIFKELGIVKNITPST